MTTEATIDRRTVTTAAWTIPVVAVAVAAPMSAASNSAAPVVTPTSGTEITTWKGDHHYGSNSSNASRRSYDFPVFVTDAAGAPINDATVIVTAAGSNRDGDLLGVYAYPAPSNGGPENSPHATATLTTGAAGRYLFAVNTQNLSHSEHPATATLTVLVTVCGVSTSSVVTVRLTESD